MGYTPNRINWEDPRLGSGLYEDMVSVLISRLHGKTQRIDGSGGDGGRDVILPDPSGPHIFELKSFTGRMGASQRKQVKKSLERAALHNPSRWQLVVPINPTSKELDWFTTLTSAYPFPCQWLDLNWLDEKMSAHLDIPRYFLEDTAAEVLELMKELGQEQAALTRGVPDAIERFLKLTSRLNTLDPFYQFTLASDANGVSVAMIPRYAGAERDRPVLIGGSFAFPDTDEGRAAEEGFRSTLDYGTPVTVAAEYVQRLEIDAPAGFGGTFAGGELSIAANDSLPSEDLRLEARLLGEDGNPVAQLTFLGVGRTSGLRGGEFKFLDVGGALAARLRLDITTCSLTFTPSYRPPANALPGHLLPALTFLSECHADRRLHLWMQDVEIGPPIPIAEARDPHVDSTRRVVAMATKLQQHSNAYFPMPTEVTPDELLDLEVAHRLLAGETIAGKWSRLTITMPLHAFRSPGNQALFSQDELPGLISEDDMVVKLGTNYMHIGRVRKSCSPARLATQPSIPADAGPDTLIELVMVPVGDRSSATVLVGGP